ncbi:M20 family metallopeptidase [Amylibacter sp. IMCC11727]|uniref:M20 family metallopeptidase n=1 Tax=Amylibacter sp. IMCC11727 TaxID=3039851 RepID=UPI00244DF8CD|nr:M20 family metallopeptidase [Amylibacter sp. IMCC11727]WGI20387.1 M20 family metallopeptidase [Amylibacter sp. IMCC11727]
MTSKKSDALHQIETYFDQGRFQSELARLVSFQTESQTGEAMPAMVSYLNDGIAPRLAAIGFDCTTCDNPQAHGGPIMVAVREERPDLPTVLIYGHGDVVHGQAGQWDNEMDPYTLRETDDRYFGRGVADNKGQHLINIAALEAVLAVRGAMGFNVKILMEMSEEIGSTGLAEFCAQNREMLAADVLIASDGPRVVADTPTLFLGSRGVVNFDLKVTLRDGANHSGNWGGLLRDPAMVLAQALASITDADGQILIPEWRPDSLTDEVKADLAAIPVEGDGIDPSWNEAGLSTAEKVFGWNSFAVLALDHGEPEAPQNAIAGSARATCQLRFVVGTDEADILPALRRHLDAGGFASVEIECVEGVAPATRSNADNPWVQAVAASLEDVMGKKPHILPNLAGWIPNHCFSEVLGMPTVWIPHSYKGCSQHAPNEHVLKDICRDALRGMVGVFWDIGGRSGLTRRDRRKSATEI